MKQSPDICFSSFSGELATDDEDIIIGFSTQTKQGVLMEITNDDETKREYISIQVNNNGEKINNYVSRDGMNIFFFAVYIIDPN